MVGRVPVLPDLVEYTETWTPAPPIREFLPHQRNKTDELWGGRGAGERNKTDMSDERELQVPNT